MVNAASPHKDDDVRLKDWIEDWFKDCIKIHPSRCKHHFSIGCVMTTIAEALMHTQ